MRVLTAEPMPLEVEVLIVDPQKRSVDWFGPAANEYQPIEHSGLIELGAAEPAQRLDWPALKPQPPRSGDVTDAQRGRSLGGCREA